MEHPTPAMERRTPASVFEMLHHERYRAEEVAQLLGIGLDAVRHAVYSGELRAEVIEHHIICIRREDVVDWFTAREASETTRR
jgi:excisionase family DNA binding protein